MLARLALALKCVGLFTVGVQNQFCILWDEKVRTNELHTRDEGNGMHDEVEVVRSNENKIDRLVGRLEAGRRCGRRARRKYYVCAWVSLFGVADSIPK